MTWYFNTVAMVSTLAFAAIDAIAAKASLEGTKTVRSFVSSTVLTRSAFAKAPTTEESLNCVAVFEMLAGGVRIESMIWITPLSNAMSY